MSVALFCPVVARVRGRRGTAGDKGRQVVVRAAVQSASSGRETRLSINGAWPTATQQLPLTSCLLVL